MVLGAEHRQEPVARVVRSPVHGDGPFEHRVDAVTNDPGRRRLRVPDGAEDLQHVGARHLRDRHPPDPRKDVDLEAAIPVPRHRRAAPPGALLIDDALDGLGERGDAHRAPLLRERVPARAGELPVGQGLLPRLGQRNEGDAAEPELALAAPDDQPLNPAQRSRLLDVEVEPVTIAVSAGRGRAHEGGREPLVGMTALGLASPGNAGRSSHIIHPLIVRGMARDYKGRCGREEVGKHPRKALQLQEFMHLPGYLWMLVDSVCLFYGKKSSKFNQNFADDVPRWLVTTCSDPITSEITAFCVT